MKRRLLAGILLLIAAALFLSAGRLIVKVDPLHPADAIVVLGGSREVRTVEALRLYREGYAPRIVLSPGGHNSGADELEQLGIHVPNDAEAMRDVLTRLGVPADAVVILPRDVDNTAQEAEVVEPLATSAHWSSLIVVTDRASTRRAGYTFRREFGGRLTIMATRPRDDRFDPSRWWTTRWSFRSTFYEVPKLLAYWLGLRG